MAVTLASDGSKTTVTHYRDGRPLRAQTLDEGFDSGGYDLKLGTDGGIHRLHGALDEVKIWDRGLTPEEIRNEARLP